MNNQIANSVLSLAQSKVAATEMVFGKINENTVSALKGLADVYLTTGKEEFAKPVLWTILEIQHRLNGPAHFGNAITLMSLAQVHEASYDYGQAEHFYVGALWVLDQNKNENFWDIYAQVFLKLAKVYQMNEKEEKLIEIESRLDAYTRSQPGPRPVSRLVTSIECAAAA